jgi:hypothetical protein
MPEPSLGLINFHVTFFSAFCILHNFSSLLRSDPLFSFGFQESPDTTYTFDEITKSICKYRYPYGRQIGLFVRNGETGKQAAFYFEVPRKHRKADGMTIIEEVSAIDITQLIRNISSAK